MMEIGRGDQVGRRQGGTEHAQDRGAGHEREDASRHPPERHGRSGWRSPAVARPRSRRASDLDVAMITIVSPMTPAPRLAITAVMRATPGAVCISPNETAPRRGFRACSGTGDWPVWRLLEQREAQAVSVRGIERPPRILLIRCCGIAVAVALPQARTRRRTEGNGPVQGVQPRCQTPEVPPGTAPATTSRPKRTSRNSRRHGRSTAERARMVAGTFPGSRQPARGSKGMPTR